VRDRTQCQIDQRVLGRRNDSRTPGSACRLQSQGVSPMPCWATLTGFVCNRVLDFEVQFGFAYSHRMYDLFIHFIESGIGEDLCSVYTCFQQLRRALVALHASYSACFTASLHFPVRSPGCFGISVFLSASIRPICRSGLGRINISLMKDRRVTELGRNKATGSAEV
jgi:hypothetical protein